MIRSLPPLPKEMKSHMFREGWRRKAGMLRAMYLISKENYQALAAGTLETEAERERALGKVMSFAAYASMMSERVGRKDFNLLDFVYNNDNWQ